MCFQVYFKPSHRCIERELESSGEDKGFHFVTHTSPSLQATLYSLGRNEHQRKGPDFIFGIILTHLLMTKGEDSTSMGSNDSVFGDSCQRGRKYEPKAKGPHHHQFQKLNFSKSIFNWHPITFKKGRK